MTTITTTIPTTAAGIIIIDKTGTIKTINVKDYKEDELYKKCGFKKPDGLVKQHTWNVKCDKVKYSVSVFAKEDGREKDEGSFGLSVSVSVSNTFNRK